MEILQKFVAFSEYMNFTTKRNFHNPTDKLSYSLFYIHTLQTRLIFQQVRVHTSLLVGKIFSYLEYLAGEITNIFLYYTWLLQSFQTPKMCHLWLISLCEKKLHYI